MRPSGTVFEPSKLQPLTREERSALATRIRLGDADAVYNLYFAPPIRWPAEPGWYVLYLAGGRRRIAAYQWANGERVWHDGFVAQVSYFLPAVLEYLEKE